MVVRLMSDELAADVSPISGFEPIDLAGIAIYLASAGLLMAGAWRDATWPVVDELAPALRPA